MRPAWGERDEDQTASYVSVDVKCFDNEIYTGIEESCVHMMVGKEWFS